MFSVIIPTIWIAPQLEHMLPAILEAPDVGEVILIDNAATKRPEWVHPHPKLRLIISKENLYVNESWNLGVKIAKNDLLAFVSDDVIFDESVFQFLKNKISADTPVVGMDPEWVLVHTGTATHSQLMGDRHSSNPKVIPLYAEGPLRLNVPVKVKCWMPQGFGMLFFLHKSQWIPIDCTNLKINFGDIWLFHSQLMKGLRPRILTNFKLITIPSSSSTSNPLFRSMIYIEEMLPKQPFADSLMKAVLNG